MTNLTSNSTSLSCITPAPLNYSLVPQEDIFRTEIARSQIKNTSDESITLCQRLVGLTTKERMCTGLLSACSFGQLALSQWVGNSLGASDYTLAMSISVIGTLIAAAPIVGLIFYRAKQVAAEDQRQPMQLNHRRKNPLETVMIEVKEDLLAEESVAAKPYNQTAETASLTIIPKNTISTFDEFKEPLISCSEGKFMTRAIVHQW